jgi:hypothetical protein
MQLGSARNQHRNTLADFSVGQLGGIPHDKSDPRPFRKRTDLRHRVVAQAAPCFRDELEFCRHGLEAIVTAMRPTTAVVVAGLLILIVGAFLWQLFISGATSL